MAVNVSVVIDRTWMSNYIPTFYQIHAIISMRILCKYVLRGHKLRTPETKRHDINRYHKYNAFQIS